MNDDLANELFNKIEKELQNEFGTLWAENKDALLEWTRVLANLYATNGSELSKNYARQGIKTLKAKLQFKLEGTSLRVIEKVLLLVLETAIIFLRRG